MLPQVGSVCLFTLHITIVWSAPSIVFPDMETTQSPLNISNKLKECIADEFKIEFKGECRSLLTPDSHVCPEGQWLVLDLSSASLPNPQIRGKCAPQRCPSHQHFWVAQRKCVPANQSVSLCPAGNTVDTDLFGDGFCDCIKNPLHIRDEVKGVCYPAYKRGPCSKDKVWVGRCQSDNCSDRRNRFPNKTIVPWSDGKCYAVNEQGPCNRGYDVNINVHTHGPECVDRLTSLNLVDVACTGTDLSGKCTRPVTPPQNVFYNQVVAQANRKRN